MLTLDRDVGIPSHGDRNIIIRILFRDGIHQGIEVSEFIPRQGHDAQSALSVDGSRETDQSLDIRGNGFIDLSLLSSGEQNEVVMLYTLVFGVRDDSMLLIDEPENSLHVLWQKKFMRTIEEISALKSLFVIVATHSPQIIGSRWDNCCDLTELMGGENDGE